MKTLKIMTPFLCFLFLLGCKSDNILNDTNKDGFWIQVGQTVVPTSNVDYYDFSTHTVYLKKEQAFFKDSDTGLFTVNVGDTKIYTGTIRPSYLNSFPTGAYIDPMFMIDKNQYALPISFRSVINPENDDPRSDPRIVEALKSEGKYHAGLRVEIQAIQFLPDNKVSFDFQLSNQDTFDYLYLDINKMGIGLFHYFTNGLTFFSEKNARFYTPQLSVVEPNPWNSWKKEWLSVIRSGESKPFTITYNQFDSMPAGSYQVFFYFPGLSFYQVEQKNLVQSDGRIWMGQIVTSLDCTK